MAQADVPLPSRSPIRRIATAGSMLIVLLVVGMAISIVRSREADRLNAAALGNQKQLSLTADERDAMYDRGFVFETAQPLTAVALAGLHDAQRRFATALYAGEATGTDSFERRLLVPLQGANARLLESERALAPVLGRAGNAAALRQLYGRQLALDARLDVYTEDNRRDAAIAAAAATSTDKEVHASILAIGVATAVLGGLLLVYIVKLLTRSFDRIGKDAERLDRQIAELQRARLETLQRLALAAEYRDDDTLHHTERVGRLTALVAERLGLPGEQIELLQLAAPLHDIGKLGIPDTILRKPGRLTRAEWDQMKQHSTIGATILEGSRGPVLQLGEEIARAHHERWDGTGYPDGLAGEEIPISARIVAIADVFDALTHDRPYKHAWAVQDAIAEIQQQSACHFDPRLVGAFLTVDQAALCAFAADSVVEPRAAVA